MFAVLDSNCLTITVNNVSTQYYITRVLSIWFHILSLSSDLLLFSFFSFFFTGFVLFIWIGIQGLINLVLFIRIDMSGFIYTDR
jgi:hypothetical protein